MTSAYNGLTEFLSDNIFKSHIIQNDKMNLSARSRNFIGKIFNNIKRAERTYQQEKLQATLLHISRDGLPRGESYSYCPKPIRDEIEHTSRTGFQYTFQIQNRTFNVTLVSSSAKPDAVRQYMNKSIRRIYMWLYVASQYANVQCSEQMNIYVYFTSLPKLLPEKSATISQANANTAFTTSCQTRTEINIFRQEEWFKTFIHETFHNMGMDFSAYDNNHVNAEIYTMFPVKTDVRLYETYCEMWGETMAILFHVYYAVRQNTSIDDIHTKMPNIIQAVETGLMREMYHSMFQVSKILSHYDITYDALIKKNDKANACKYKEDTPALSYFVIKSILLFNIDYFMVWCDYNNRASLNFTNLLEKDDMYTKMARYCEIVRKHYTDPAYIDVLNQMQQMYNGVKKSHKNKYILKNLRMTITEY